MQREVRNIIFTDHAIERLQQRRITQLMVVSAIRSPDSSYIEDDGDTKFIKTIDRRQLHVVGHWKTDQLQWLIKSAWVRGENDAKPSLFKSLLDLASKIIRALTSSSNRRR
ncbi:MAG: DUF4258 domain-containing protein [Chloroflexota bacterium]|nr:DUF4258 domain-containing protein [Chloroflexota bacterium]